MNRFVRLILVILIAAAGMGIAVVCAWARALKVIVAAGGLAAIGALVWKARQDGRFGGA